MYIERLAVVAILLYANNLRCNFIAGKAILGLRWKKKGLYGRNSHIFNLSVVLDGNLKYIIPSRSIVTDKQRAHDDL